MPTISAANTTTQNEILTVSQGGATVLTVGTGDGVGDYDNLPAAIAAISDSAIDKPYVIRMLPGLHTDFTGTMTLPDYTSLVGFGMATKLRTEIGEKIIISDGSVMSDLWLEWTGNDDGAFVRDGIAINCAINTTARIERCFLESKLTVEDADAAALGRNLIISSGLGLGIIKDCHIVTMSTAISQRTGTPILWIYNTDIHMIAHGQTVNAAVDLAPTHHRAIVQEGSTGGRIMYSGGFIGCGYGYDNPDDDNADVTCFYQDSSSGAIVFIFNAQSFAKSDATVEATTRVIQTIDGVSKARAFGCFMQAEPATNADALTVEGSWDDTAGGGGAVELWGSRISHQTGNVFGQGATIGVTSVDHAYDNYALQKFETGLFLADTDTSAFTLILAADARSGERITLRNVGGSANDLTIDPAGTGTINGAAAGVSIAVSDGEAITLICAGGGDWWTENNI